MEDNDYLYLIFEFYEPYSLLEYVYQQESITEQTACIIISQILDCLEYLNRKGVIMRDLNYNNIFIVEKQNVILVKIVDIEYAKILYPNLKCNERVNTICSAPELVSGSLYDSKVDVWSIGILLYFILSQNLPYKEGSNIDISFLLFDKIPFDDNIWLGRSSASKDLINKCMKFNQVNRISLKDLKKHEWLVNYWD
jgi:serine/threonine protein kinase